MPTLKHSTDVDLDAITARIDALETDKANKTELAALAQIVANKADQTDLNALAARVTVLEQGGTTPPVIVPKISVIALASLVNETALEAWFAVRLSQPTTVPVSVRAKSLAGAAIEGSDYDAYDRILTVNPGSQEHQFKVVLRNDTEVESDEGFAIVISEAVNGVIVSDTAPCVIRSDDVTTTPPPDSSAFVKVAGVSYPTMLAAINACPVNGIVDLFYNGGVHLGSKIAASWDKKLTIRGVRGPNGELPVLDLGGTLTVQKAILNPYADFIGRDFRLMRAKVAGTSINGKGIFPEPACLRLSLYNVWFEDCQEGFMSPTTSPGAIYLFEGGGAIRCGTGDVDGAGIAHNYYIGRADQVTFRGVESRECVNGHNIKSRALRTFFENSKSLDARVGRAFEASYGGYVRVLGNSHIRGSSHGQLIALSPEGEPAGVYTDDFEFADSILEQRNANGYAVYNYTSKTAFVRRCTMPGATRMFGPVSVLST